MTLSQRLFAACYDLLNARVESYIIPYREKTAGLSWGDTLEIGGGTGANLPYYPSDVRLTMVEPNPHMIKRLANKAETLGRQLTIVPDDGENILLPDASFDTIVTTLVLCMVDDLEKVVMEVRRLLRPNGDFFFYEHVVSQRASGKKWQDALNPVWKILTTGCNLNRDIEGCIKAAGFREVDTFHFDLSVGLPVTIPNIIGVARL